MTDVDAFYGFASPMWSRMTLNRNAPTVKGGAITSLTHRLGISHPMGDRSVIRFFYGRFTQFPSFQHLFYNSWESRAGSDLDLNGNGAIDPAERWNHFGVRGSEQPRATHHNPHLPAEETTSFEVGVDWNFVADYVLTLTTYYKGANNQIFSASQQFRNPETSAFVANSSGGFAPGDYRDTRGIEFGLKKRFSHMMAFNFSLNLQWADRGRTGAVRRDVWPDSFFVANGHFWTTHDIDPVSGAEHPVSLRERALREGKDPDFYIKALGHNANEAIRKQQALMDVSERSSWSWVPGVSHFAAEGVEWVPGQPVRSFYSDKDRAFWERVNRNPNYPGVGEGTLLVGRNQEVLRRQPSTRNRKSFGSLTLLFASPPGLGPAGGKMLGNLRANLVYRFYTGTVHNVVLQLYDERIGRFVANRQPAGRFRPGPIHTRVDLNAIKVFGRAPGKRVSLGIEVFNLFNQKDPRSVPSPGRQVDFDASRWHQWGIEGPPRFDARGNDGAEIFDINNYWDLPRETTFSVQVHF